MIERWWDLTRVHTHDVHPVHPIAIQIGIRLIVRHGVLLGCNNERQIRSIDVGIGSRTLESARRPNEGTGAIVVRTRRRMVVKKMAE